ncbi:MAG: LacI family DNA-binding transcriptional regulator [Victivallaceae bacterium]|nr:LacI family DNA-binding transcriptional regulator [Victivallaceae bacterium]
MIINKTDSIRTKIFRAILKGDFAPGEKLPTERDMAELTGTSRVTVRRAYEQLEQSNILQREHGRGTFVAKHSAGNTKACSQIALLTSISDHFALEFIRAVEEILSREDMLLILRITDETPEKEELAAIDLVGKGVNNLIIWPSGHAFPEKTFERLRVLGTNMVFFDRVVPRDYADYVGLDNDDAMDKLFEHAAKSELKNPIFVTHSDLQVDSDMMRLQAFNRNCTERGLKGTIIKLSHKEDLSRLPEKISQDSTAFCVNDIMADKLKPFITQQSIYSIDGFINYAVSYKQPMRKMAELAVSMLLEQQKKGSRWKASQKYCKGELVNV